MKNVYDLTFTGLQHLLAEKKFNKNATRDIWQQIYELPFAHDHHESFSELTKQAAAFIDFSPTLSPAEHLKSTDGTQKFLFRTRDSHILETVFIPQGTRKTLCVSSQLGCAFSCRFCATGAMGLVRNLQVSEIICQVIHAQNILHQKISNVVFMGMGDPLANFSNVKAALEILTHTLGLSVPPRRITLSTMGILPAIRELIESRSTIPLAISLHHHDQKKREELMPATRSHPLPELLELLKCYNEKVNRPVFFEYLLLKGVNDSLADAEKLLNLLSPLRARINLIPFHSFPNAPFEPSSPENEHAFYQYIQNAKIPVIVRKSRGQDIRAACGQLAGKTNVEF